jgi:hypothetical protein
MVSGYGARGSLDKAREVFMAAFSTATVHDDDNDDDNDDNDGEERASQRDRRGQRTDDWNHQDTAVGRRDKNSEGAVVVLNAYLKVHRRRRRRARSWIV